MAGPVKRSVAIAGHATSISLEPVFWQALAAAAVAEGLPLSALVARIDASRIEAPEPANLASAIRVWLFERAQPETGGSLTASSATAAPDCRDGLNAPAPDDCTSMAEVRRGVDAVDRALGALLAQRFGYMRAAARIKPDRGAVRDEARKAEVIANAVAVAQAQGWPEATAAELWERLVEASIAYEFDHFDAMRGGREG